MAFCPVFMAPCPILVPFHPVFMALLPNWFYDQRHPALWTSVRYLWHPHPLFVAICPLFMASCLVCMVLGPYMCIHALYFLSPKSYKPHHIITYECVTRTTYVLPCLMPPSMHANQCAQLLWCGHQVGNMRLCIVQKKVNTASFYLCNMSSILNT